LKFKENKSLLHWNYLLALESDVERLARFVEFAHRNFETYSIEMAHLFLAAASEVDVVAKQLCSILAPADKATNMKKYREALRHRLPEVESLIVTIPRYGLEFQPWSDWRNNESPNWWRDHNKVKHQRRTHFHKANLRNVLDATAGLFLLLLYYYRGELEGRRIEPPPNLLTPPPDIAKVCSTVGGRMALFFNDKNYQSAADWV
jgi:hypothetical protein